MRIVALGAVKREAIAISVEPFGLEKRLILSLSVCSRGSFAHQDQSTDQFIATREESDWKKLRGDPS